MEDVQGYLKRPQLYQNIDGSSELMLGCMMIGFMVFEWVLAHSRQNSIWTRIYALPIFVALLMTALIYGTRALKSHITFRRTGFVTYRKPNPWWLGLIGFLAASVAGGLAFLIVRVRTIDATALGTICLGLFLTVTYAYGIARKTRWKWVVAALLMIASIVIAMLPAQLAGAPMSQPWLPPAFNRRLLGSLIWYETSFGVILLISGGISLALYLRNTRRAETE